MKTESSVSMSILCDFSGDQKNEKNIKLVRCLEIKETYHLSTVNSSLRFLWQRYLPQQRVFKYIPSQLNILILGTQKYVVYN